MASHLRLAVSATFLGVLVAFFLWSVQWSLSDRRDVTVEMPGKVTTLKIYKTHSESSIADVRSANQELRAYLTDFHFSLIVASPGDGTPQMTVFDPTKRLVWFNPTPRTAGVPVGVYLFEGSYSAHRWKASSSTPLLPVNTYVAGIVSPPAGTGDLQYVEPSTDVFPPGDYVLSGTRSVDVVRLRELLRRQGLEIQEAVQIPLVAYLVHAPLVVATALFLISGYVCAAAYWSLLLGARNREFIIRRRHGARLSTLIRRWFASGLPSMVLGLFVGVSISGVVVNFAGRESLSELQYLTLILAVVLGLTLTSVVWLATVSIGLISRDEVSRAA